MNIDKRDADYMGKMTIPFVLAIFLALFLEDIWDELLFEYQLFLVSSLVLTLLLIYRKKVVNIMR